MLSDLLQPAKRLGVLVALGAACGCSLNPQPLPPGEASEGGTAGQYSDATAPGSGDAAGFGGGDSGPRVDATADGAPAVPPTDAGDAESDAGEDGPSEGGLDGPSDGGSEDGE